MSATGSNTPANHFGGSFGPNEWLVDEMYEKYLADPNSVDTAWAEFFADYKPNATRWLCRVVFPDVQSVGVKTE